jgi:hypothetical protein
MLNEVDDIYDMWGCLQCPYIVILKLLVDRKGRCCEGLDTPFMRKCSLDGAIDVNIFPEMYAPGH